MRYLFSLLLLLAAFFLNPTANARSGSAVADLVYHTAQQAMQERHIPGVAVAVFYKGKDYIFVYGDANKEDQAPITKETLFELASVTKVFTTSLLAIAVKEGRITLSDSIGKYLPELSQDQNAPIYHVKIVDLATHTASLPRNATDLHSVVQTQGSLMQRLKDWQPTYPIGSHHYYSNLGFDLLGKVIAAAYGEPFETLLEKKLCLPLNMTNTFINVPQTAQASQAQGYNDQGMAAPFHAPDNFYGSGSLRSCAVDMLIFLKANLEALPQAPANLMNALKFAQGSFYEIGPNAMMGLGWNRTMRNETLIIDKNGRNRGFNSYIGLSPQNKFGVVVLANKRDGMATIIGKKILSELRR